MQVPSTSWKSILITSIILKGVPQINRYSCTFQVYFCILYLFVTNINIYILKLCIYFKRERKERERERNNNVWEKYRLACLLHAHKWGPGLQPKHASWLVIEPATFQLVDQCRGSFCVAMENVAQPLTQKISGEWVGTQYPSPQIGSPLGNQACIVPRLLWGLVLLKLSHPELRQQMFTAYL